MTLSAGTRLGPYEILAPLGAGGMGEVYRARDPKLRREVAIKVLPGSLAADPDALGRFEREALAVAALSHPNILSIFEFGTYEGTAYAVMELLEGETLRGRLDSGPIQQKQAVDYALQVAKGLSAAHEKGIVHRDLKPENLFVSKDGHLKILDFGLAKRVDQIPADKETSAPTASAHTEPGTVMGTVGYMSPEQVRGLPIDHRTDIFSFGAILYEMLSGQRAFKRDTAADTMSAILKEEPPELSETGKQIPPLLDHTIRRCLEKDRDRRFQTARDLEFTLSEAFGPAASVPKAAASRSRLWITAAVLLVVAALVGLYLARRLAKPATPAVKRIAVLPFENLGAPEDDYFAEGVADAVRGRLTSLPGIEVIARVSCNAYRNTARTPREIAEELKARWLLSGTVRWQKSESPNRVQVSPELVEVTGDGPAASRWQQPLDAPVTDVFRVQADIATRVAQSLGVALAAGDEKRMRATPTANLAAYEAFLRGEHILRAEDIDLKAIPFYEQAVALDPDFAQAWAALGFTASWAYASEQATSEMADRARRATERAVALSSQSPETFLALGSYLWLVAGEFRRALTTLDEGCQVAPENVDLLCARGAVKVNLGLWHEGVADYRRAEQLDPRSPDPKIFLGTTLLLMRDFPAARTVLDELLEFAPGMLSAYETKAGLLLSQGDLDGARALFMSVPSTIDRNMLISTTVAWFGYWVLDESQKEAAKRLWAEATDDDRFLLGVSIAHTYYLNGDVNGAHKYASDARRQIEERLRTTPSPESARGRLAMALAILGERDAAIRESERTLAKAPARNGLGGLSAMENFAEVLIVLGENERAVGLLEELMNGPVGMSPGWLRVNPAFYPLRGNPRFQKLVAGGK